MSDNAVTDYWVDWLLKDAIRHIKKEEITDKDNLRNRIKELNNLPFVMELMGEQ